jgi:hypothetical protein
VAGFQTFGFSPQYSLNTRKNICFIQFSAPWAENLLFYASVYVKNTVQVDSLGAKAKLYKDNK